MLRASTIAVLGAAAALGIVVGGGAYALVGPPRDPIHPTASPPESNATRSTAAAATSQAGQAPESTATPALTLPSSADLRSLAKQVAAKSRGRVQVAVIARRRGHIVVASSSGSASTPVRIWSVSKVATTIALLEAHGWNRRPGRALRADVDAAVRSALVRSSDCAQRQLVVELQEALGGIEPARKAVQQVLRRGGARHARVLDRVSAAGSGWRPLRERTPTPAPSPTARPLPTRTAWRCNSGPRSGQSLTPRVSGSPSATALSRPRSPGGSPAC